MPGGVCMCVCLWILSLVCGPQYVMVFYAHAIVIEMLTGAADTQVGKIVHPSHKQQSAYGVTFMRIGAVCVCILRLCAVPIRLPRPTCAILKSDDA